MLTPSFGRGGTRGAGLACMTEMLAVGSTILGSLQGASLGGVLQEPGLMNGKSASDIPATMFCTRSEAILPETTIREDA